MSCGKGRKATGTRSRLARDIKHFIGMELVPTNEPLCNLANLNAKGSARCIRKWMWTVDESVAHEYELRRITKALSLAA